MEFPRIIQGGMGVAVSSWQLANAVSRRGQLGVISGTGIDTVVTRRLQLGDVGGHIAEALSHFPFREMADRIYERYFLPNGKADDVPFKSKPVPMLQPSKTFIELTVVSNFVEVWLAKHGHNGLVGINLLEKIQVITLPSLYGAMLAGVDAVLMGAGIPRAIPGVLDKMAKGETAELQIDLEGGDSAAQIFDPSPFGSPVLPRPKFFAIVSSASLATMLARKCSPAPDGFVIEGPTAGGHNAPPRGAPVFNEKGEPLYGERDIPDLEKFRELGLPFWMAGSYGTHEKYLEALSVGAQGIQVGTAFAFCDESGLGADIKAEVIQRSLAGKAEVLTDGRASPTGFPFKVVAFPATVSEPEEYARRERICDLGYLRKTYLKEDGTFGYRCPSEPVEDYVAKGGNIEDTVGRKCVCNGLLSTIGLGQVRKGIEEPPIITAGDDVADVARFLKPGRTSYTADDVLDELLGLNETPELLNHDLKSMTSPVESGTR